MRLREAIEGAWLERAWHEGAGFGWLGCYLLLFLLPWLLSSSSSSSSSAVVLSVCGDCSLLSPRLLARRTASSVHSKSSSSDHPGTGTRSAGPSRPGTGAGSAGPLLPHPGAGLAGTLSPHPVAGSAGTLSPHPGAGLAGTGLPLCHGLLTSANHPYCLLLMPRQAGSQLPVTMETVSMEMVAEDAMTEDALFGGVAASADNDLCGCFLSQRPNSSTAWEEEEEEEDGGWSSSSSLPDLSGPCSIARRDAFYLTQHNFLESFAYKRPVVLTGLQQAQAIRSALSRRRLLAVHGHDLITMASANTNSYQRKEITLCNYISDFMHPPPVSQMGNETLYYFGDNDREGWSDVFSFYRLPPFDIPSTEPMPSFGLAGAGTGVPFHVHGATFAETIYGRKRWFLYPPEHSPVFHPNASTLHWYTHTYPTLSPDQKPLECTLSPGELLFIPEWWWHATLNVDPAVFMSVFYA